MFDSNEVRAGLGLNSGSKFVENVEKDARAAKDAHVSSGGAKKGFMPAIQDNEERFSERTDLQSPSREENWFNPIEHYDVSVEFYDVGHDISNIELKAEIEGIGTPDLIEDDLSDYIDEVDRKLGAVNEGLEEAKKTRKLLQDGEKVNENDLLRSLLGASTSDYSDNPGELIDSGAAEESSELDEMRSLKDNGVPLLDDRIDSLDSLQNAYVAHAAEVADRYHADAKSNIKKTAEGAEEALETFAETAKAAGVVSRYAEETVTHENYEEELANEEAALQTPVREAATEAVEESVEVLAEYMQELESGIDDLEEAADRFGKVIDGEEVRNMDETVEEYREGMVDLAENVIGRYTELETEHDSFGGYVMEMMNQTDIEVDTGVDEDDLNLVSYGQEA